MKFGQKILDEFENVYVFLKNMAANGRGIFPYMAVYGDSKILLTL